jgi:hypothetical protein
MCRFDLLAVLNGTLVIDWFQGRNSRFRGVELDFRG